MSSQIGPFCWGKIEKRPRSVGGIRVGATVSRSNGKISACNLLEEEER